MDNQLSYQGIVIKSYAYPIVDSIISNPTKKNVIHLINELTNKCKRLGDKDMLGCTLLYIGAALKEYDFASYYIFLLAFYEYDYEGVRDADKNIEETLEIINELRS